MFSIWSASELSGAAAEFLKSRGGRRSFQEPRSVYRHEMAARVRGPARSCMARAHAGPAAGIFTPARTHAENARRLSTATKSTRPVFPSRTARWMTSWGKEAGKDSETARVEESKSEKMVIPAPAQCTRGKKHKAQSIRWAGFRSCQERAAKESLTKSLSSACRSGRRRKLSQHMPNTATGFTPTLPDCGNAASVQRRRTCRWSYLITRGSDVLDAPAGAGADAGKQVVGRGARAPHAAHPPPTRRETGRRLTFVRACHRAPQGRFQEEAHKMLAWPWGAGMGVA